MNLEKFLQLNLTNRLPKADIQEILDIPKKYIIGIRVDIAAGIITLYLGDFSKRTLTTACLEPSGNGIRPNFNDVAIINFGYAVRFGEYEAASDALLQDADEFARQEKEIEQLDKQLRELLDKETS